MTEFYTPFVIATLLVVIIIQAVERYLFSEQAQRERSRLLAAVLSKNMQEYTQAVQVEKEKPAEGKQESDEIDLSLADDETFKKFLQRQ